MANCRKVISLVLLLSAIIVGVFCFVFPGWLYLDGHPFFPYIQSTTVPADAEGWYGLFHYCFEKINSDHCHDSTESGVDLSDSKKAGYHATVILVAASLFFMLVAVIVGCFSAIAQGVFCILAFLAEGSAAVVFGVDVHNKSDGALETPYYHFKDGDYYVCFYGCILSALLALTAGLFAFLGRQKSVHV